ncbi:hypothetical protein [Niallia taxi]|mgnify:CR=1 FL=1|uniref:Uncharacterized protein n=2 Tax=Niallia taxi TaxID=2499688 RepID=A0A437KC48_9BACI|nr:hypothetical protein [Niallia taxi]MCM3217655.1 hypothetical protein [Niallia taxi]MCT2344913.1 hypothetical protein [Niallia taxi]MDE5054828.1 hypothetical protein [Niallia taxi]MDK8640377.1 hypothetical protein [Niallia taxi]MED4037184.1 hypothetical protein [Niallia taxi]
MYKEDRTQRVNQVEQNGLSKYEYHMNILRKELMQCRTIKIPFQNISISHQELADWIIEELSPQELNEIIVMLSNAKKRSSSVKPLFQVIATGLIKN